MKTLLFVAFITAPFSMAVGTPLPEEVSAVLDTAKSLSLYSKGENGPRYRIDPSDALLLTGAERAGWLKTLHEGKIEGAYPLMGYIARILVLDRDGRAVCIDVLAADCLINVRRAHARGHRYWTTLDRWGFATIRSERFTRMVYDYMRRHYPDRIAELDKFYTKYGHNLDELLFGQQKP